MPWRGPEYEGEFPSLGWELLDWFAEFLVVPDGPLAGEPLELTDEQATLLVRWYQIDDRGRFVYRRACKRAPQGWGKSPLLGGIALGELAGPCRFGGWDANGEPVAIRPQTPWVQVAAVSEDQTDNTYAAAYAMVQESELAGKVVDVGLTRMFLAGETGRLEPVTASAGSRLGQRITFAVLDETHLWRRPNGGHKLAATIRRNAGKMNGRTFESTNAHLVGEDSVAERTFKAFETGAAGLLYDALPGPDVDDLTDMGAVRESIRVAYGDSVKFVDLDRLALEVADPGTDPDDARRFFLNQLTSGGQCPFDMIAWDKLAKPRQVEPGTWIGLGFDGSYADDRTVLYGCVPGAVPYLFKVAAWQPKPGFSTVPRLEVHSTVAETMATMQVGRMFADPPLWRTEIEDWQRTFLAPFKSGDDALIVLPLDTNQAARFAPPCDRFATAVRLGQIEHDGSSDLRDALAACAKKRVRLADDENDGRSRWVVTKADARKIDDAVGAILALEAAMTMPEPEAAAESDLFWA